MDVIIHQFLILICRSAPEISREVKEVVQYCTGLSDKRLDHGYIICYGRGVTVKCKSKIHLFSKMICQNIFQAHSSTILFCMYAERATHEQACCWRWIESYLFAYVRSAWRLFLTAKQYHMNCSCSHNQAWLYSSVAHIMEVSPDHTLNIHVLLV